MSSQQASSNVDDKQELTRALSNRHLQLIAIGGAIGTGLFLGSGKTISVAGPSIVIVYTIIGAMLFFMMRALGELLLSNLRYRNFADFAGDLLGPWASFFVGWTYWLSWIVVGVADIIAIAGYIQFWWPDIQLWIPALATVLLLVALNLPSVRAFGEVEFWFAMIKIVAIVALIFGGIALVLFGFQHSDGTKAAVSNLWSYGGIFPHGFSGFVAGFQIALFAFLGVELVGTAAAETKDPEKNLPRAVNNIPIRVLIFYVGALLVIMMVTPWNQLSGERSPFVETFTLIGLAGAAGIINFVVATSATSSANSGIYSTSRMMFGLAGDGAAPAALGKLTRNRVPVNALLLTGILLLSGVALTFADGGIMEAFTIVTTVASVLFLFVWTLILVSYLVYRKKFPERHASSKFKMPGGVVMASVVLAFFAFIVWALTQADDTRTALLCTLPWFVVLAIAYQFVRRSPKHIAAHEHHMHYLHND